MILKIQLFSFNDNDTWQGLIEIEIFVGEYQITIRRMMVVIKLNYLQVQGYLKI